MGRVANPLLTKPLAALCSTAGDGARAVKVTDIYSGAVIQATRSGGAELVTVYFEDSGVSELSILKLALCLQAGAFKLFLQRWQVSQPARRAQVQCAPARCCGAQRCDAPAHVPHPACRCPQVRPGLAKMAVKGMWAYMQAYEAALR